MYEASKDKDSIPHTDIRHGRNIRPTIEARELHEAGRGQESSKKTIKTILLLDIPPTRQHIQSCSSGLMSFRQTTPAVVVAPEPHRVHVLLWYHSAAILKLVENSFQLLPACSAPSEHNHPQSVFLSLVWRQVSRVCQCSGEERLQN